MPEYPGLVLGASTPNYKLPKRLEIELWSSKGATDGTDLGLTNAVECHGGENNGNAQRRLAPASGKFASLPGLEWMRDIKAFGFMWSQNTGDEDVGGGTTGIKVDHDYMKGGPWTRNEHIFVLDCAGYDHCELYWQMVCENYEGMRIKDDAEVADGTKIDFVDSMTVQAAGMPAIDSTDGMFSIPKLMRVNEHDSLATEQSAYSNPTPFTFTVVAATDVITTSAPHGLLVGDVITFVSATTLPAGLSAATLYFVLTVPSSTTMTVEATLGGGVVDITDTGTGVHSVQTMGKRFTADAGTDVITTTSAHGLAEGAAVQLMTTDTLPAVTPAGYGLYSSRAYYARDVTPTTFKVSLFPGSAALDLASAGTGTHYILRNTREYGMGGHRASPWVGTRNATDVNWEPQRWVHGADILWAQFRASFYPGDDRWWHYDKIMPALSWELLGSENDLNGVSRVGPVFSQFGKVYKSGATKRFKLIGRGDKIDASIKIGYPFVAGRPRATDIGTNAVAGEYGFPLDLRITGLARIALTVGAFGVNWYGESVGAQNPGGTFLASTPVAPAVAPRQHVRGRLIAVLTRD